MTKIFTDLKKNYTIYSCIQYVYIHPYIHIYQLHNSYIHPYGVHTLPKNEGRKRILFWDGVHTSTPTWTSAWKWADYMVYTHYQRTKECEDLILAILMSCTTAIGEEPPGTSKSCRRQRQRRAWNPNCIEGARALEAVCGGSGRRQGHIKASEVRMELHADHSRRGSSESSNVGGCIEGLRER